MKKIRVLLSGTSRFSKALVAEMEAGREFEVLGLIQEPLDLLLAVKDTATNVVAIISDRAEDGGLGSHLLAEYPNLTLLLISPEGAVIEQLCSRRTPVQDRTPAVVLDALRECVEHPCEP